MSTYAIQESPLGTYALLLGTQLIIQSTDRTDCERMKATLENSTHAERVLRNTYYDAETNTIRDGIEAR